MPVFAITPKFLYPIAEFSYCTPRMSLRDFDIVAEDIVRAIEKRNWTVPGISLKFDTYGSGESKYQMISRINGSDFKLSFSSFQRRLDSKFNDTAGIFEICIPKQIIHIYKDINEPRSHSYYLYVGKNWEADKDDFMNSVKQNSKTNNKSKTYLYYTECGSKLVADNYYGREYDPERNEPTCFYFDHVYESVTTWLEEHVLQYILAFPEVSNIGLPIPAENPVPYTGSWDMVFATCYNEQEVFRINKGKENPNELEPKDRHANFGCRAPLIPNDVRHKEQLPEVASNNTLWCNPDHSYINSIKKKFAERIVKDITYLVAIKLKYANHIYVADNAVFFETKEQLLKEIAPRVKLTDSEIDDLYIARGKTIIPVNEYNGAYKLPIVLINRELDFDEIAWVVDTNAV